MSSSGTGGAPGPAGSSGAKSKQKGSIRSEMRALLKVIPREVLVQQSRAVFDRLHRHPKYLAATSIALFLSMPSGEIDTMYGIEHALANGKLLFVPKVSV
jgi:5-formyltetrahydrofolate cyclo-ligase